MWIKENIPDQFGKTIIVTGANTGIGFETALALYEKGAHIVLACRDLKSAEKAMIQIQQSSGTGSVECGVLDLSSLDSVREFAHNFTENHQKLHILINNAGVMIPPPSKTTEGFELQFGVNFLGHFALTGLLYPSLVSTEDSRVVTLSSMAYLRGIIDFDNLKSEKSYDPMREYCQSKLADILFSVELHRRLSSIKSRILSLAAQPGANKTSLSRYMSPEALAEGIERVGALMDPWQGALSALYAATFPRVSGEKLYGPDKDGGYRGFPAESVIAENGLDKEVSKKLWNLAEKATGVYFPPEIRVSSGS